MLIRTLTLYWREGNPHRKLEIPLDDEAFCFVTKFYSKQFFFMTNK